MSIATEITRLQNAKSALATSIGNKGVTVPSATKLDGYAALVDSIQTGGGSSYGWQRPSAWPDLSSMDRSGQVLYLTYDCRNKGYTSFNCGGSSYTVEKGTIANGTFNVIDSTTLGNGVNYQVTLPTDTNYIVFRITSSGNITGFSLTTWQGFTVTNTQPILEAYGYLPYSSQAHLYGNSYIVNFDVKTNTASSSATQNMFRNDERQTSIEHVNFGSTFTYNTANMVKFLNSCRALKFIDSKVVCKPTDLSGAFSGCSALTNIDLSGFDTSICTTFANLFDGCSALKDFSDLSDWDTSSVTNLSYAFSYCSGMIDTKDIEDWDVSKVKNFERTFNLTGLEEVDLSDWDMSLATNTTRMFSQSKGLRKVILPASLPRVDAYMFFQVNNPCVFIFNSTTPPTMANTNAFSLHTNSKIYVPDASVNAYKTASNWSNFASYIYPISDLS